MGAETTPGGGLRSAPAGGLLPGTTEPQTKAAPPVHERGPRRTTTARPRTADRMALYECLQKFEGRALSIADLAERTRIDRIVTGKQMAEVMRLRESYPGVSKVGYGTYRYDANLAAPVVAEEAPVRPEEGRSAPEAVLLTIIGTLPSGALVGMDDDTGRSWVLTHATAADLRSAT